MKDFHGLSYLGDLVAVVMTATQTNETFQLISLILTIIATASSIVYTCFRFFLWYKKASEDGKITADEIKEAENIIQDGKNQIDDINKKGGK